MWSRHDVKFSGTLPSSLGSFWSYWLSAVKHNIYIITIAQCWWFLIESTQTICSLKTNYPPTLWLQIIDGQTNFCRFHKLAQACKITPKQTIQYTEFHSTHKYAYGKAEQNCKERENISQHYYHNNWYLAPPKCIVWCVHLQLLVHYTRYMHINSWANRTGSLCSNLKVVRTTFWLGAPSHCLVPSSSILS